MKMTNEEINIAFAEIADEIEKYDFEAFGGKAIPYMGWFWRDVDDFSNPTLGIADDGSIGFMENNKWDYGYVTIPKEKQKEFRTLCERVAKNPSKITLEDLNNMIQSFGWN